MSIPKPVQEQELPTDVREQYLEQWKKLFSSIDPQIRVTICSEGKEPFTEAVERVFGDIEFAVHYADIYIVVELPDELKLNYLVGIKNNQMFSHEGVLSDPLLEENDTYPCVPETMAWSHFYQKLCDIATAVRSEVPAPPDTEPGQR